ncbi:MAG: type II toxin-antitoxin system HigA family antitoxin [Elusimicrobiota bacterium]
MTTLTIEKKVRKYPQINGHLFQTLILRLPPQPMKDKNMHKIYSSILDMLSELIGEKMLSKKEKKAIETYFGAVSHFVSEFEQKIYPNSSGTPEEMLQFFMDQFHLKQTDLSSDLGGQPVVSDILNGRRKLNRDQIERLAHRFHVNPGTFYKAA